MAYYRRVLGVSGDADYGDIRKAYHQLALKYHPDKYKDNAGDSDRLKYIVEINAAYAELTKLYTSAQSFTRSCVPLWKTMHNIPITKGKRNNKVTFVSQSLSGDQVSVKIPDNVSKKCCTFCPAIRYPNDPPIHICDHNHNHDH